jgi:hypothetical protein
MADPAVNTTAPAMEPEIETPRDGPEIDSEADKWKKLSRTNEARWKAASSELEAVTARGSELEAAMTAMRHEHEQAIARIQLEHAAQRYGLELSPETMAKLNLSSFLSEDGTADLEAITGFVGSLAPQVKTPKFPQNSGVGPQGYNPGPPGRSISLDARARR